jgi:hypothetical protein
MQNGSLGFLGIGKVVSVITYPIRKLNDVIGDDIANIAGKIREYGCVIVNNDWVVNSAATGAGFAFSPVAAAGVKSGAEAGKKGCKALDIAEQTLAILNPSGPRGSSGSGITPTARTFNTQAPLMFPPGSMGYKDSDGLWHIAVPSVQSKTGFLVLPPKSGLVRDFSIVPREAFEARAIPRYRQQDFYKFLAVTSGLTLGVIGVRAWSKRR